MIGWWKILGCALILFTLAGCSFFNAQISQEQILDLVWADLDPYTRSHNRANWQVKDIAPKRGEEAAKEFEGKPFSCIYPQPPPNQIILPKTTYWYVHLTPKPATPAATRMSPTAPPAVPEPFLYQALYLVDGANGKVVARKLFCVIY